MKTFLIVVAGVVVGVLALCALLLGWIKYKVGNVCQVIGRALAASSGISPFRIHLEAENALEWADAEGITRATRRFESLGYTRIGDWRVPELEGFGLRSLLHPTIGSYAVLYDHAEFGLFADLVCDLADGTHISVSCAPESGMDRPTHAPLFRLEVDVREEGAARSLHERLLHETIDQEVLRGRPEQFESFFTEAYAQEMDWRIARGGVTRAEIERIAALGGLEAPDDNQVELIQTMWKDAIADFIEEEVVETWLAESPLSALDWERLRDRVQVVHDHRDPADWINELAWCLVAGEVDMQDDEAVDRAQDVASEQIQVAFEGRSPREGFRAAQALLPEKHRFEPLGSVEVPWPADLYARPEAPDDC